MIFLQSLLESTCLNCKSIFPINPATMDMGTWLSVSRGRGCSASLLFGAGIDLDSWLSITPFQQCRLAGSTHLLCKEDMKITMIYMLQSIYILIINNRRQHDQVIIPRRGQQQTWILKLHVVYFLNSGIHIAVIHAHLLFYIADGELALGCLYQANLRWNLQVASAQWWSGQCMTQCIDALTIMLACSLYLGRMSTCT